MVFPASRLLARLLQLQDELAVPLGLVMKEMGQHPPETHLSDPHAVLRQLRLARLTFPLLRRRARRIDRRHRRQESTVLHNQPLPAPPFDAAAAASMVVK